MKRQNRAGRFKLSQLGKNKVLADALTLSDPDVDDGVIYMNTGLTSHRQAKTVAVAGGTVDAMFEVFERTWSANQSYGSLSDPTKDIVLEMGCANMLIYNAFKMMRSFPNYIGVDIRRDYLQASQHRHRKDVLAMCADLTAPLPIKDGTVSAVILSEVIEHLTEEQNIIFFKEAFRLLKPGGKVMVSSPINTKSREFHNVEKERNLGHVFFWTVESFEAAMRDIGFSSVDKKWGLSTSSKITVKEIKKNLPADVGNFIEQVSGMYGTAVARAIALSAPNIVNGGCRFIVTK